MKTNKLNYTKYIRRTLSLALFGLVACAKVDFTQGTTPGCTGNSCTTIAGVNSYNYNVTGSGQPIDILFVVDNSASMSAIQQGIAAAFGTSLFTTINQYDYHLAITTTEIADPVNAPARATTQFSALQNGNLIRFGNGAAFLTSATANAASLFSTAIYRPESVACDTWVRANCAATGCAGTQKAAYDQVCASGDTRGIYAANMTVNNDATGFSRAGVPLAVVIISNADERANGGYISGLPMVASGDYPQNLIDSATAKSKKLAAYPIIVKPGDAACLAAQTVNASLFGYYGNTYNSLAALTGGTVGSVCPVTANSYATSLATIGSGIVNNQLKSITLNCAPTSGTVSVKDSTGVTQVMRVNATNPKILDLPAALLPNQSINLQYSCSAI
jgi:hypothetical protein